MADKPVVLLPGDAAPRFITAAPDQPRYAFDSVAGRWVILVLAGSTRQPLVAGALEVIEARRHLLDDEKLSLFCVTSDEADVRTVRDRLPGWRWLFDIEFAVARLYGAVGEASGSSVQYYPQAFLLDPMLRVVDKVPLERLGDLLETAAGLPDVDRYAGVDLHAPVLIVPRIFEPEFCQRLIELYETQTPEESGFMRDIDGRTTQVVDPQFKRRSDVPIGDRALVDAARARVRRRLVPQLLHAYQFTVTRIERDIVACYEARNGGHFRPHRDNTTAGTAHRRFAVSINLNEDFAGGDLVFPEFGSRRYRPPLGGAVVFSCSLLHWVQPMTAGRRYAYLPFLYDEAAAEIRLRNNEALAADVRHYKG